MSHFSSSEDGILKVLKQNQVMTMYRYERDWLKVCLCVYQTRGVSTDITSKVGKEASKANRLTSNIQEENSLERSQLACVLICT